jgi:PAB1-binding protein PBP1
VTLKSVREIGNPSAPQKEQFFIAATNIESWTSGPADAKLTNGDCENHSELFFTLSRLLIKKTFHFSAFRTDTEISSKPAKGEGRSLLIWSEEEMDAPLDSIQAPGHVDDETFGAGASVGDKSWDQFAANENLYGITTTFDENLYTTKLDRSGADYKERERKAQKIANEIMGVRVHSSFD